jgi:hypothetical protein
MTISKAAVSADVTDRLDEKQPVLEIGEGGPGNRVSVAAENGHEKALFGGVGRSEPDRR